MRRLIVCFLCVGILLCALGCSRAADAPLKWELICLDVGQGHCALLRTPDGDVLVDAGPENAQNDLRHRLKSLGVERLKLMILTHPDEDHIGGADGILEQFDVDEICTNGTVAETDSYERLMGTVRRKNVPMRAIRATEGFTIGGAHISVLWSPAEEEISTNDASMVLLIRCDEFGALLMGDVSMDVEQTLIEEYGAAHLQADVLIVGHHGANTSTSEALLETVRPQYAVISCGAGNLYGHPDGRALARLEKSDAEILRTDLQGDLRFAIYENEYKLSKKGETK